MRSARIVVLVVAVTAGGLAVWLASGPEKPPAPPPEPVVQIETTEILVAKADLGMGQVLSAGDVQWQVWPATAANPNFVRRSDKPDAIQQIAGAIVRTPFISGEPIREAKLVRAGGAGFMAAILPTGMRAISTVISAETGAGGFILPNDRVDVILTRRDREAEKQSGMEAHVGETILSNVRVLAIDQTLEEKSGQKAMASPKTATLELTPRQAEILAVSRDLGTLSLALRSIVDANAPAVAEDPEADSNKNKGRLNMVRFGVSTSAAVK
jgi:pilus assembly protein CpaB